MSDGLETTFRLLAETDNEAASRMLIEVLDSPYASIRRSALGAILNRRSLACHREIVARLHTMDESWKKAIEANHARMTPALREAVLHSDRQVCLNGCMAVVWFQEYDLVPAVLNALEDPANPNVDILGKSLMELVDLLCAELGAPREYGKRRDPELLRRQVLNSLELSVGRFAKHGRREVLDAFTLLVSAENLVLREILQEPRHPTFPALMELFAKSMQPAVMRLLLSFLDDPRAPSAALGAVARRRDANFVEFWLRKIGRQPSAVVAQNLKRIESVGWVKQCAAILGNLDDLAQHAAVRLAMISSIERRQAFLVLEYLLKHGRPGGRRASAEALDAFHGTEANALALKALDDPDPEVQATVLLQIRRRGIPGALGRLVEMLDSPHGAVRKAARKSLNEFTFQRFLRTFDLLDDEVRKSTGELVKKVDPHTVPQLRSELASRLRTRRLRGLAILRALDLARPLEPSLLRLIHDEDHMVRAEAAAALARCNSRDSRDGLWETLGDRSLVVRESARRSLEELGESPPPEDPFLTMTGERREGP